MNDEKIYGVIAEWKEEGPIVLEGQLLNYNEAHTRMRDMASKPTVIRVAIFKAVHADGHAALVPQEAQP